MSFLNRKGKLSFHSQSSRGSYSSLHSVKSKQSGVFEADEAGAFVNQNDATGSADFTVINKALLNSFPQEEHALTLHDDGYPIAMKHLIQLVKTTSDSIKQSGGKPVTRRGFVEVKLEKSKRKPAVRYAQLSNGKLIFFVILNNSPTHLSLQNRDYVDNADVDPEDLRKDFSYAVQRIHAIKYKSLEANSFTLVVRKPKKDRRTVQRNKKGLMSTVNRLRSMSNHTLGRSLKGSFTDMLSDGGMTRQTSNPNRGSFNNALRPLGSLINRGLHKSLRGITRPLLKQKEGKSFKENDIADADSVNSQKVIQNRMKGMKKSLKNSKPTSGANRARTQIQSDRGTRASDGRFGTAVTAKSHDSSFQVRADRVLSRASVVSAGAESVSAAVRTEGSNLIIRDESGNNTKVVFDSITFSFEDKEMCQDWLKHILREIENQAHLFLKYVETIQQTKKENIHNAEILLRKAIDLFTLSKGVKSELVLKTRARLGKFLQKINDQEYKLWFDMARDTLGHYQMLRDGTGTDEKQKRKSMKSLTSFGSFGSFSPGAKKHRLKKLRDQDEARTNLVDFLSQYGRGEQVSLAEYTGNKMLENMSTVDIAVRLFAEYNRVPDGYETFLLDAAMTPLEMIQGEVDFLKEDE